MIFCHLDIHIKFIDGCTFSRIYNLSIYPIVNEVGKCNITLIELITYTDGTLMQWKSFPNT